MARAFISYVGEDRGRALRLAHDLSRNAVEVWVDRMSLAVGLRWADSIERAIGDADYFLACFSGNFAHRKSTYMHRELKLAVNELQRRGEASGWFIPVRFDETQLPEASVCGCEIRALQWVDLFPNWDDGIARLLRVIEPHSSELTAEQRVEEALRSGDPEVRLAGLGLKVAPSCLLRHPNLRVLDLSGNAIDALPEWFAELKQLHQLDLSRNRLTDFPIQVCNCAALEWLDISGNSGIKTLPESLSQLVCLETLDCQGMELTSLPKAIFGLADRHNLKTLYLEDEFSLGISEDAVDSADPLRIAISWSNSRKRKSTA